MVVVVGFERTWWLIWLMVVKLRGERRWRSVDLWELVEKMEGRRRRGFLLVAVRIGRVVADAPVGLLARRE